MYKPQLNLLDDDLEILIDLLYTTFQWKGSPQGYEYWLAVANNLEKLRKFKKED